MQADGRNLASRISAYIHTAAAEADADDPTILQSEFLFE
jgi:hypothetical protein